MALRSKKINQEMAEDVTRKAETTFFQKLEKMLNIENSFSFGIYMFITLAIGYMAADYNGNPIKIPFTPYLLRGNAIDAFISIVFALILSVGYYRIRSWKNSILNQQMQMRIIQDEQALLTIIGNMEDLVKMGVLPDTIYALRSLENVKRYLLDTIRAKVDIADFLKRTRAFDDVEQELRQLKEFVEKLVKDGDGGKQPQQQEPPESQPQQQ